jgi:ADP-ribosylglycohydrolase
LAFVGVPLATTAGEALGAAYEFGPPRGSELEVAMVGGGSFGWGPGEWTDDTSMAIAIAEVAATGADVRDEKALGAIVARWDQWLNDAKDVGIQTSSVLHTAQRLGLTAHSTREASAELHERTGRTAGNDSLIAMATDRAGRFVTTSSTPPTDISTAVGGSGSVRCVPGRREPAR